MQQVAEITKKRFKYNPTDGTQAMETAYYIAAKKHKTVFVNKNKDSKYTCSLVRSKESVYQVNPLGKAFAGQDTDEVKPVKSPRKVSIRPKKVITGIETDPEGQITGFTDEDLF